MEVTVPVRVAPVYLRRRHHLYVDRAHADENFSRRTMVVSRKPLRSQRRYQALDKGRKRGLVSNASALSTDPATVTRSTSYGEDSMLGAFRPTQPSFSGLLWCV